MRTAALLCVVLVAGCVPRAPAPDHAALGAAIAVAVATVGDTPAPPPPEPAPDGKVCPECAPDGRPIYPSHPGMVGDGTVFTPCPNPSCPWRPATPPPPPPPTAAVDDPGPPPGPGTWRRVCRGGRCTWERVR